MDNKENKIKKSRLKNTLIWGAIGVAGIGAVEVTAPEAEAQIFRNRAAVVKRQAASPVISPGAVPYISKNTITEEEAKLNERVLDTIGSMYFSDSSKPHGPSGHPRPSEHQLQPLRAMPGPTVFIKNGGMNVTPPPGVKIWDPNGKEPGIRKLEDWEPTLTKE